MRKNVGCFQSLIRCKIDLIHSSVKQLNILEDVSGSTWTFPIVTTFKKFWWREGERHYNACFSCGKRTLISPDVIPFLTTESSHQIVSRFILSSLNHSYVEQRYFVRLLGPRQFCKPPTTLWIMTARSVYLLLTQAGLKISLGCSSIF